MAPLLSAKVRFSGTQSCFLDLPKSWVESSKFSQDVPVFVVKYGQNGTAFFSFKGGTSNYKPASNEMCLSRKYGVALGLTENEEVVIQQYEKSVAPAEKIVLEPSSFDDWEIMSLNSKTVESDLLNQIRVVWKGQIFPVWAHSSSFSVKVVEVIPSVDLVLLVEWTEVHIIPKERTVPSMNNYSSTPVDGGKHLWKKYNHLRQRKSGSMSSEDAFSNSERSVDYENQLSQSTTPSCFENANEGSSVLSMFQNMVKTVFSHSEETSNLNSSPHPEVSDVCETEYSVESISLRLRVIPCSRLSKQKVLPLALQSTTIFISDQTLLSQCQLTEIPLYFVASLSKLLSPLERHEKSHKSSQNTKAESKNKLKKDKEESFGDKKDQFFSSLCVQVVVIRSFDKEYDLSESLHLPLNYVAVPKELKRALGLEVSSVVHCESVPYKPISIETLQLCPLSSSTHVKEEAVVSEFMKWAKQAMNSHTPLLISDGTLVSLPIRKGKPLDFAVALTQLDGFEASQKNSKSSNSHSTGSSNPESASSPVLPLVPQYGFLREKTLPKVSVKLGACSSILSKSLWCTSYLHKVQDLYFTVPALRIEALGGVKSIYEKAMEDFTYWLKLSPVSLMVNNPTLCYGSMLICGPKGVGKSTLAKALCRKLSEYQHFVYTKVLDCRPLRGKRVETISKNWEAALAEAVHREPSVLLFDDLDQLASAPATPEQEVGPDGIYFSKIAQVFLSIINSITCQQNKVVIVATSKSVHTVHPSLISTRGLHTFRSVIELPPPSISQREDILRSLILSKVHLSADSLELIFLDELAQSTEGYIAQDLDFLVDKATHAALLRIEGNPQDEDFHDGGQIMLCDDDFKVAMEGYTPSSLRGLHLHQRGNKMWKDVGGLHHVKKTIQQILWWPVKYQKLISKCPIKPQSNILLYGAPGTGKTLLANVVASECGLNFISIKGPELLSKYIGASEEAVRDLFRRALSAKPCIIFFDEFDSIAPKRGHDSTGVTDRVVNQFLTQMDGVESAQGVYVLAASSRPDLIDPALLRPGRLDKCLHCPLPDEPERLEILLALSAHLTLGDDVDFHSIAKSTENFSGADLQALLYSSQLGAFHDIQASKRRLSLDPSEDGDICNADMIYMPSLLEGPATPSPSVEKKIVQEVNIIKDNIAGRGAALLSKRGPRKHSFVSIVVQQKHLDKVLSEMKPSVSEKERKRYQAIYDKFINSHGGDFTPPSSGLKKVTLA